MNFETSLYFPDQVFNEDSKPANDYLYFCNATSTYAFLQCSSPDWLTTACQLCRYIAQPVCNLIYWFDNVFGIKGLIATAMRVFIASRNNL